MIPRCFVDPAVWNDGEIPLTPADAHHVANVLRLKAGDPIMVCDGKGGEALGELSGARDGRLTVRARSRTIRPVAPVLYSLVQAVPKGSRMDWIVEKATELGVWSVTPVMTRRGVVRLDGERAIERQRRWQRICVEAARQCRTAWIPRIDPIVTLEEWLGRPQGIETVLVGALEPPRTPLAEAVRAAAARSVKSVALIIGPEGDLSPEEMAAARQAGAIPVGFGDRVLRVETAALYGLCVLAYEFGSLSTPVTHDE